MLFIVFDIGQRSKSMYNPNVVRCDKSIRVERNSIESKDHSALMVKVNSVSLQNKG